jgi:hypothetical protein
LALLREREAKPAIRRCQAPDRGQRVEMRIKQEKRADVDDLLPALQLQLDGVMNALAVIADKDSLSEPQQAGAVDDRQASAGGNDATLQQLLVHLRELLEVDDSDATRVGEQVKPMLVARGLAADGDDLTGSIDDFDFDRAIAVLDRLERDMSQAAPAARAQRDVG